MSIIQDGTGTGNRVKVSGNRLFTQAVSESEALNTTQDGDAYNINTGIINISGTSESAILYVKNNEDRDLVIEALAVGLGDNGTSTDPAEIMIIKNPTGGDIISNATAVDMNVNRNFGSSKTLTADAYKGTDGGTATGGTDAALFIQNFNGRLFAGIGLILPKGNSLAVTIDPNHTLGSVNCYAAVVCYLKADKFID